MFRKGNFTFERLNLIANSERYYRMTNMASTSSTYPYYPNYQNHLHHHHHHMYHNAPTDILTGFAPQTHPPNQTAIGLNSSANSAINMYQEYGLIQSDPNFYESESNSMVPPYYHNQSNNSDHAMPNASQHLTSSPISSSNNEILPESASTHVISSDNGLSYTNLDYMYSATPSNPLYLHQEDDKSVIPLVYNQAPSTPNLENTGIHSQAYPTTWHSQSSQTHFQHSNHSHHSPGAYLENSMNSHQIGLTQLACLQNQTPMNALGANSNGTQNRNLNNKSDLQVTPQQTSQIQSPQSHQPTYKWMQVKRNVPKPQGMHFVDFPINTILFAGHSKSCAIFRKSFSFRVVPPFGYITLLFRIFRRFLISNTSMFCSL